MSDNSTGAGGTAAPGWYADPYDSTQLRWWSGQAWTEHVSPVNPPAPATADQQTSEEPAVGVDAQPEAHQEQPENAALAEAGPEPEATFPAGATTSFAVTPSTPDALPSRRALREAQQGHEAEPDADAAFAEPISAVPEAKAAAAVTPPETAAPESPAAAAAPAAAQGSVPVQSSAPVPQAQPAQETHQSRQALRPEDFELAADQNRWNQPLATGAAPSWGQPQFAEADADRSEVPQPETARYDTAPAQSHEPGTLQPGGAVPAESTTPGGGQPTGTEAAGAVQPVVGAQPDTGATATDDWGLRPSAGAAEAGPHPTTANTPWVWLIAASPLIAAAIVIYGLATGAPSFSNVLFLVGLIAPYLLVVVFALADRSRLAILGFPEAPSWTWAALTAPVYLVVRGGAIRRELGSAGPALYVWLACFVVGVAAFGLYGLLSGHALVPGLPEGTLF